MENNKLDSNTSGTVSGLEFEISEPIEERGLEFDDSVDIVVGEPESKLELLSEFSVPDSFDSEEYISSQSFISRESSTL